jgi:hypothetical protein
MPFVVNPHIWCYFLKQEQKHPYVMARRVDDFVGKSEGDSNEDGCRFNIFSDITIVVEFKAFILSTFSTFATFDGGFDDGDLECFLMDESFMVKGAAMRDVLVTFLNLGLILSDYQF